MNDLISRQAAIATAISGRVRTLPTTEDGENWIRVNEVRDSLLGLPSAERHGHWINVNGDGTAFRCSVCGEISCCNSLFCGDCGAKMDEEDQPKRFWPEQVEKLMMEAIAKAVTKSNKDECVVGCDGICEECPMGKEENK